MEENKSEYEATSNSYRKAPKIAQKMLLTKAVEKSRTKLQEITSMQEMVTIPQPQTLGQQ